MEFNEVLKHVKANQIDYKRIEFDSCETLSLNQLKQLKEYIARNNFVGDISWCDLETDGDDAECQRIQREIETLIQSNNLSFKQYPSDFCHLLLCLFTHHAHEATLKLKLNQTVKFEKSKLNAAALKKQANELNEHVKDWQVLKIYKRTKNKPKNDNEFYNDHFSLLFVNNKAGQLALCHSGLIFKVKDILLNLKTVSRTDTDALKMAVKLLSHQHSAYTVSKDAVDAAQVTKYNLSVCGHGFGAWLAELSVFFCLSKFKFDSVKLLTFDSVNAFRLDGVSYLTVPNLFNSCLRQGQRQRPFAPSKKALQIYKLNCSKETLANLERTDCVKQLGEHLKRLPGLGMLAEDRLSSLVAELRIFFGHGVEDIVQNYVENGFYAEKNEAAAAQFDQLKLVQAWPRCCLEFVQVDENAFSQKLRQILGKTTSGDVFVTWFIGQMARDKVHLDSLLSLFPFANLLYFITQLLRDSISLSSEPTRLQLTVKNQNKSSTLCEFCPALSFQGEYTVHSCRRADLRSRLLDLDCHTDMLFFKLSRAQPSHFEISPFLTKQLNSLKKSYRIETDLSSLFTKRRILAVSSLNLSDLAELLVRLLGIRPKLIQLVLDSNEEEDEEEEPGNNRELWAMLSLL